MKTYVLTISDYFPKTHTRKGRRTFFKEKILANFSDESFFQKFKKLHTIRENYNLWLRRFFEIEAGRACLSLRFWSGKPYHSKQIEFVNLTKDDGISLQRLEFEKDFVGRRTLKLPVVNGNECNIEQLSFNDGFSELEDFESWFKNSDLSKPFAIIHFTGFHYGNGTIYN